MPNPVKRNFCLGGVIADPVGACQPNIGSGVDIRGGKTAQSYYLPNKNGGELFEFTAVSFIKNVDLERDLKPPLSRIFHDPAVLICKAFKDAAVIILLQVLNNAANERRRERLEGEIISAFEHFGADTVCLLRF